MAPKAAASAAVGRESRSASKGPDGSKAVSGGIQSASSFTGSKAGFPSSSSKAAISAGNADSAAVGGSAPPVAMKSPVANQSQQYYVKSSRKTLQIRALGLEHVVAGSLGAAVRCCGLRLHLRRGRRHRDQQRPRRA